VKKVSLMLIILALSALACSMGGLMNSKVPPTPTATRIPVSTEAVISAATQVAGAMETAQAGGPIVIELTDAQATSAAAMALQEYGQGTGVSNLQVRFLQDRLQISGDVSQQGFSLPLLVTLKVSVDNQGLPHTQAESATVGSFPVPQAMLNQLTDQLDHLLIAQVGQDTSRVKLQSIGIVPGKLTIVATVK
jgi:hypothetical protein